MSRPNSPFEAAHVSTRLLVVSHTYTEPANRGKWRALADLAPDWAITVITPTGWRDPQFGYRRSPAEAVGSLRFVPMRSVQWGTGRYVFVTPAIAAEMRRFAPHLIYVEAEPWSPVYLQIVFLRRWLAPSAPLAVFSWWNTPEWTTPLKFPGSAAYAIGRRATTLLVAGNHAAAALHARHGFPGRVCVIPQLGVDPATHAPGPRDAALTARFGLESCFVIGFAGRLTAPKAVEVLVRAAAGLQSPDWKLLIVGRGPEEASLRALAADLGVSDRLVFVGSVSRGEMPRYLRLMDVLVLPSRQEQWEQFGHVLIEAMACGVTVVGSTSGEIPQVIGDADLVFPADDVTALTGKLRRLRHDPEFAAACRAAGLARVHSLYSNQAVAGQLRSAFEPIVRGDERAR